MLQGVENMFGSLGEGVGGGKSTTFLGMIDLGDMIYICFYGAMRVH